MPQIPFQETQPYYQRSSIHAADGTSAVNWTTQLTTLRQVDQLLAANGDSIDHILNLFLNDGINGNQPIGSCTVPARAGFDGIKAADIFALAFPTSMQPLEFDTVWFLTASVSVAMTGSTVMTLMAIGGLV